MPERLHARDLMSAHVGSWIGLPQAGAEGYLRVIHLPPPDHPEPDLAVFGLEVDVYADTEAQMFTVSPDAEVLRWLPDEQHPDLPDAPARIGDQPAVYGKPVHASTILEPGLAGSLVDDLVKLLVREVRAYPLGEPGALVHVCDRDDVEAWLRGIAVRLRAGWLP
jgi:hypothetical protein